MHIADKHDSCGSGPVVLEDQRNGWRAICCACWTHGPIKTDRASAIAAWDNLAARKEWREAPKLRQLRREELKKSIV